MGYALAAAARDRGAPVTLLSGPTGLRARGRARFSRSRPPRSSRPARPGVSRSATASSWPPRSADFLPEQSAGAAPSRGRSRRRSALPGARHARSPGAAQARTDRRRLRGGNRRSRGPRPREAGGQGRRPDRRQRRGAPDIGFEAAENEVLILARGAPPERVSRRPKGRSPTESGTHSLCAPRGAGKRRT